MENLAAAYITEEEYLAIERKAERKSEYYKGEMFLMAGAKERHNLIVTNLVISIGGQLKDRPCQVYSSDMRVKVTSLGLYTYPDLVVTCENRKFLDKENDTLLNPELIIEVLSDSTEIYDRGKKFELYRGIDSLKEYVLVSQNYKKIESFLKNKIDKWELSETNQEARFYLSSISCTLSLIDVYDKVDGIL